MKTLLVSIIAISTFSVGISAANISHPISSATISESSITYIDLERDIFVVSYDDIMGKTGGYCRLFRGSDGRYYLRDNNFDYWLVEKNYDKFYKDLNVSTYSYKSKQGKYIFYFDL